MLTTNKIIVSVIIPCRNEEKFIDRCLDSIIANDYPKEDLEVLVVDGMSEDRTREIVRKYADNYSWIKLVDNPKKIVPTAMNIGIENAQGDIIMRMDAHNVYSKDYISKCAYYLNEYDADNVGGVWITLPGDNTLMAESIALALSHPFGVGNAHYRTGAKKLKYVDTVPFGCFRKEIFKEIGLFDEDMLRNEDDEFNTRLIKNGYKILLMPDVVSYYYARDSLAKLWKMCFQYGYFKPLVVEKSGTILTWRQLIPALFLGSLILSGILPFFFKPFLIIFLCILIGYSLVNMFFSSSIAFKKGLKYALILPFVFSAIHFSYGWGYLRGIWHILICKKNKKKRVEDVPLTR